MTSARLGRLTQRDMTPKEPQRVDRVEGDATRRDSDNGVNGIWREPINPM